MKKRTIAIAAVATTAVGAGGFAGIAAATGGDDDQPITGAAREQASAVALEHTGQGRVSGTEVGDEDSFYEVEVTLDDGSQVDVQLDESFHVVGSAADIEDAGEDTE